MSSGPILSPTGTEWDDYVVNPVAVSGAGVGTTYTEVTEGFTGTGMYCLGFPKTGSPAVTFAVQLPHGLPASGGLLYPHLHLVLVNTSTSNVKFDTYYRMASPTGVFGASESSISSDAVALVGTARYQQLLGLGTIDARGYAISTVIQLRVVRDNGVASNHDGTIYVASIDVHFERNTLGSKQVLVK